MAAVSAVTMEDELSCSYCLEVFVEPLQLECGHSLCRRCVDTMTSFAVAKTKTNVPETAIKRTGNAKSTPQGPAAAANPDPLKCVECPLCRAVSKAPSLKVNINLKNLCEAARARQSDPTVYCSNDDGNKAAADCVTCSASFCNTCVDIHKKPAFRSHVLHPAGFLAKQPKPRMCPVPAHATKPLELLCQTCDALVCATCAHFGKHKGHDCQSLDEAVEKKSAEMKELIAEVSTLSSRVGSLHKTLADELKKSTKDHARQRQEISEHFDRVIALAAETKTSLLKQFDDNISSVDTVCKEHHKSLAAVYERAKAVAAAAERSATSIDVLNPYPMLERCVQLRSLLKDLQGVNLWSSYRSPVRLSITKEISLGVSLLFASTGLASLPDCSVAEPDLLRPLLEFLPTRLPGCNYSLIYRGSRNGFDSKSFYAEGNNKWPTLLIARSQQGFVFGGYARVPWGFGSRDSNAFLFTVNGGAKQGFCVCDSHNFHSPNRYAYRDYSQASAQWLPASSLGGTDLVFDGISAYSTVGGGFRCPDGESSELLFRAKQTTVTEVEVYSVSQQALNVQVPTNRLSDEVVELSCSWLSSFGYAIDPSSPLYSSARDGSSNQLFHERCDNKGPTFVVVFTAAGTICGGFTHESWKSGGPKDRRAGKQGGTASPDPRAFLFLLRDGATKEWVFQRRCVVSPPHAMYLHPSCGPSYGSTGRDLCINLDQPASSSASRGNAYENTTGFPISIRDGTGSCSFVDVRVYSAKQN